MREAGPFDKLRDRGSFATVSELASGEPAEPVELAVKFRDRGSFSGMVSELVELVVKLMGRGSFATVSELVELAVKHREGQKYLSTSF